MTDKTLEERLGITVKNLLDAGWTNAAINVQDAIEALRSGPSALEAKGPADAVREDCLYEHGELYIYDATSQTFDPAVKQPLQGCCMGMAADDECDCLLLQKGPSGDARAAVIEALKSIVALAPETETNKGCGCTACQMRRVATVALSQSPATE